MKTKRLIGILFLSAILAISAFAGMEDRMSDIVLKSAPVNYAEFPEISAPSGNPDSNKGWLYVKDNSGTSALYFEDDGGTVTNLIQAGATAWSSIADAAGDSVIAFGDNEITELTFADTNEDMFTISGQGAFGDVSVVLIQQETGNATDGTVLEVVAADANVDPLVVSASGKANAFVVGQNTGVVTVAGVAEGTDALIITAGDLKLSDGDIDLSGGDAIFAEDLSVGGNVDITGTLAVTGATTLSGTFYTSALAPSSGNITLNAAGSGTVSVGNSSTGAIILTGGGVDIGDGAADTLTITGIIDANTTWDDGTTDSPHLILKDSDDEQTEMYQDQDTDDFVVECNDAEDSFAVITGNLSAGEPNSDVITMNGDDLFVADDAEIDGLFVADGGVDINEDVDIDLDATDEEVVISTSAQVAGAGTPVVLIESTAADVTTQGFLLELQYTDNGDADADFLVMSDNNGGTDLVTFSEGGTTAWVLDAGSYLKIDGNTTASTTTGGVLDIDVQSATNTNKAVSITYQLEDGATAGYGIYIDLDDDTTGAEFFHGLYIANSAGTNATSQGITFANTIDDDIVSTLGAAGQVLVVDATTTTNTGTAGAIIDAGLKASENGQAGINIDLESTADGAGELVHGLLIGLDDGSSNATAEVRGLTVAGDGDDGTGLQNAIVVSGANMDAGLYLQTGYLRVGTGSSPDQTPGDDDGYFEGTLEVDGNFYPDGNIVGDGATEIDGYVHDVTDGAATNPYTVTIAMCGGTFYNSQAIEFDLPEASTAIGCKLTFGVQNASNLDVDPEASDIILGATDAAGNKIRSGTVGDTVTLQAISASQWIVVSMYPASTDWTDED